MIIFKQFSFDSAHFLSKVPPTHKCSGIHGHTYRLTVHLEGPLHEQFGWVMDYGDLKEVVVPVVNTLDHKLLNNIPGLENPTCEIVAQWIWNKIKPSLPLLSKVELWETATSGVIYTGQ